jgi:hypothetical protein
MLTLAAPAQLSTPTLGPPQTYVQGRVDDVIKPWNHVNCLWVVRG